MLNFSDKEINLIKRLNTAAKVQDFLNTLPFNFEEKGETLKSPLRVLREKKAHCFEGALLAAYIFSRHSQKPLILHLKADAKDFDHVIALFKKNNRWGAVSKTNHAVLRYREPVYKNIRELVMSYFHEYFLNSTGQKTLRSYSKPLNLNLFEDGWEREEENLWGIDEELDKIRHYDIMPKSTIKNLRKADKIEIQAGQITQFKKHLK